MLLSHPTSHGFTLLELMVSIALLAILITLGIPSFSSIIRNNQASADSNSFVTGLNLARSEAVKRNTEVRLSPIQGIITNGNTQWSQGWLVWTDSNNNNSVDTAEIIRRFDAIGGELGGERALIRFAADGSLANPGNNSALAFALTPHGCQINEKRLITISATGHVATSRGTCS